MACVHANTLYNLIDSKSKRVISFILFIIIIDIRNIYPEVLLEHGSLGSDGQGHTVLGYVLHADHCVDVVDLGMSVWPVQSIDVLVVDYWSVACRYVHSVRSLREFDVSAVPEPVEPVAELGQEQEVFCDYCDNDCVHADDLEC